MIKEYLKKLEYLGDYIIGDCRLKDHKYYKELYKYLEEIKDANPSEALKCLSLLGDFEWHKKLFKEEFPDLFDTIKQALMERIVWKHIHNTKVKIPLCDVFNNPVPLSKEERYKYIEYIYYHWEEMKEALEDKNSKLEKENAELKVKSQKEHNALRIIKEKRVDLPYLRCCIEDNQSVYRYNEYIRNKTIDYDHEEELTEDEFSTLKEVLE